MDEILSSDEESVLADDYDAESDFETESDGRIDSTYSHDDSAYSADDAPVPVAAAREDWNTHVCLCVCLQVLQGKLDMWRATQGRPADKFF
jgi:hypothetical protein